MLVELSYVCILSLLQLLIWISYLDILPEAICCCLQTYTVNDVLLVMYCMCLPAFFVTSAVVDVVLHNCAQTFMITCANISYYSYSIYCLRLFVIVYKHVMFVVGW